MARDGTRTGGRKLGTPNKATATREAAQKQARANLVAGTAEATTAKIAKPSALDIIEEAMLYCRGLAGREQAKGEGADGKKLVALLKDAAYFADKLAPYRHPRLTSLAVRPQPYDLSRLTDEELHAWYRLMALAGGDAQPGSAAADRPAGGTTETSH